MVDHLENREYQNIFQKNHRELGMKSEQIQLAHT